MSKRLDQEREKELQPKRMQYALGQLRGLGLDPIKVSDTTIKFEFNSFTVLFYPYTGWYSGKGVGSGRGIHNLIKKLQ